LLLDPKNVVIADAPAGVLPQYDLIDPHPTPGGGFGTTVTVLRTGNVVVTNPNDNFGGAGAGAAYLFGGQTGALLSTLVGSSANDHVSSGGVTALNNGNYVVRSSDWDGQRGAATWGDGTAGVSGAVGAGNSLVGSDPGDQVGVGSNGVGVTALANGNYVVQSPNWGGGRGAVTWGDGTAGVSGAVDAGNSLVGSSTDDHLSLFLG